MCEWSHNIWSKDWVICAGDKIKFTCQLDIGIIYFVIDNILIRDNFIKQKVKIQML